MVTTLTCGDAQAELITFLTSYFTDVVEDVSLIADCLTADTMVGLTARIESILATAKLWEEEVGTEQEFKEINWDWLTFDLTVEDITDEWLEEGLEGMEELQMIILILLNDNKLIDVIQEEIGNRASTDATTTAGAMAATTTAGAAAATTTANGILAMASNATTTATILVTTTVASGAQSTGGNPYAPGQGIVKIDKTVLVTNWIQE